MDVCTVFGMSVLTFGTAPWAIRTWMTPASKWARLSTVGLLWFSASGSYDLYCWWRFGFYPPTWASNLVLSSITYILAGFFWNLEYSPSWVPKFSWQVPATARVPYRQLLLPMLFMTVMVVLCMPSLFR